MKRLLSIIIFAAFSPLAWSQAAPISGQVINQYGQPVSGAQVYVCSAAGSSGLPCSPLANIFYDYNLTSPAPNPFSTDVNGNFNFYVGALAFPNTYVVNAVTGFGTPTTQLYSGPACQLGGCTFTGNVTAPTFNATSSPYYEINGTQISSSALSDHANIAYLSVANVFTGTPQTAPIFNATTQFNVAGSQIASANLADGSNLAKLNASNTFTGTTNAFAAITATTIQGTTINATTGFEVGGVALSASNLSNGVSGSGAICLASGSACAGSSASFATLTGGTNTAAAMLVGTGSSLGPTGSGTITATNVTATGSTQCLQANSSGVISGSGGPCSSNLGILSASGTCVPCSAGNLLIPGSGLAASSSVGVPLAAAGTISTLYVILASPPGTSGDGLQLTVYHNGSSTSLTCTVTYPATTCSDTTHSFTVAAGDFINLNFLDIAGASNNSIYASVL